SAVGGIDGAGGGFLRGFAQAPRLVVAQVAVGEPQAVGLEEHLVDARDVAQVVGDAIVQLVERDPAALEAEAENRVELFAEGRRQLHCGHVGFSVLSVCGACWGGSGRTAAGGALERAQVGGAAAARGKAVGLRPTRNCTSRMFATRS